MAGKSVALGIIGGLLGGLLGAGIGIAAGYAIAELVGVDSHETQAYFQVFVAMPLTGLLGMITGGFALAGLVAQRKRAPLLVASIGGLLLLVLIALALRWWSPTRPAEIRVRNDGEQTIEQTMLGADFRRSSSLGDISPGETTAYVTVDLDEPGSFATVRSARGSHWESLTLSPAQRSDLDEGRYTFVIDERDGALVLLVERED